MNVFRRRIFLVFTVTSTVLFLVVILYSLWTIIRMNNWSTDSKYPHNHNRDEFSTFSKNTYTNQDDQRSYDSRVSRFATDQYECHGTCSCEPGSSEFGTRRSLVKPVKKVVTFFVVALTSIVARDVAKRHFEQKCLEEMEDECDDSYGSVHSEIESCQSMYTESSSKDEKVEPDPSSIVIIKEKKGVKTRKEYRGGRRYLCKGICDANRSVMEQRYTPAFVKDAMKRFKCNSISAREKEVRVFAPDTRSKLVYRFVDLEELEEKHGPTSMSEEKFYEIAVRLYRMDYLDLFCSKRGEISLKQVFEKFHPDLDEEGRIKMTRTYSTFRERPKRAIREVIDSQRYTFCSAPRIRDCVSKRYVVCKFIGSRLRIDKLTDVRGYPVGDGTYMDSDGSISNTWFSEFVPIYQYDWDEELNDS